MQAFWAKIIAFFMSILAFFGLAKPAPKPETTHDFQPFISSSAVIEKVYCADDGCKEEKKLNFSLPMKDRLKGSYDCSADEFVGTDNGVVFLYDTTDFSGYVDSLQTLGCKIEKNYTMGGDRYALLSHEYFTAYVSFLNAEQNLRVYIGKNGDPAPENSPAINGDVVSASLWQLDIDNESAGKNGGMGYVLQLSDGRFIVVDGGYETESDADALYAILSANKPAAHPKPIVAAWFVTHMHVDHYGVIYPFAQRYLNAVTVQGFYYNFPYNNKYDIWAKNCLSLENAMREYDGATLYRKLHSGMSFSISDAEITVLCTFEDVYPFTYTDANDTSLVFSVKLGGQKILFLADAEWGESDRLVKLDGAVLKADILQYAHHGYDKQCKANLYEKIDPSVVLWPMPLVNYESGTRGELFAGRYENNSENEWIRSAEGVKKIILKDEGPEKISLPFFPSGNRITDYHALYENLK